VSDDSSIALAELVRFDDPPVPVRDDILAAHRLFWRRISEPGTWWTGAERVAIAAEVRAARGCELCLERKQALSPNAVEGEHDCSEPGRHQLSEIAIDAAHRIVTDAGRLSRAWLEKAEAAGLDDARYVELLGLVVAVTSIDVVCRGLGVPLHPLPEPIAGEPSRLRPALAMRAEAFVPMLPSDGAVGAESDRWQGRTGNVIRARSLVPEAVRDLKTLSAAHYLPVNQVTNPSAGRTLSRPQIELVAGRVSALNECFY